MDRDRERREDGEAGEDRRRRDAYGGGDFGSEDRRGWSAERRGGGRDERPIGRGEGHGRGDYRGGVGAQGERHEGGRPHDHGFRQADEYRGERGHGRSWPADNEWVSGAYRGEREWRREGDREPYDHHANEHVRGGGPEVYGGRAGAASGRPYGGGERGASEGGRDFWDKAADDASSGFGSRDGENRRRPGDHRGRGPKGYSRSDERIREDVNDRLTEDAWVDASNVEVSVENGEVTLAGSVTDRASKRRAEDIAESVTGVGHVQNNLRVHAGRGASEVDVERGGGGLVAKPTGGGQLS